MQCKDVEQAEVIDMFMPLILNAVARFALTVEDMVFGTANGPIRFVAPEFSLLVDKFGSYTMYIKTHEEAAEKRILN